jgi:hypothetical protein
MQVLVLTVKLEDLNISDTRCRHAGRLLHFCCTSVAPLLHLCCTSVAVAPLLNLNISDTRCRHAGRLLPLRASVLRVLKYALTRDDGTQGSQQ